MSSNFPCVNSSIYYKCKYTYIYNYKSTQQLRDVIDWHVLSWLCGLDTHVFGADPISQQQQEFLALLSRSLSLSQGEKKLGHMGPQRCRFTSEKIQWETTPPTGPRTNLQAHQLGSADSKKHSPFHENSLHLCCAISSVLRLRDCTRLLESDDICGKRNRLQSHCFTQHFGLVW